MMKQKIQLLIVLLVSSMTMWAQNIKGLSGDGSEANPYIIANNNDWATVRNASNAGNDFKGKFLKATADITTGLSFDKSFCGNFDFCGHTLTAKVTNRAIHAALFCSVSGATIRNLRMGGEMEIGTLGAALVGGCDGTLTLENIVITTHLKFEPNEASPIYGGGIIGFANSTDIVMNGVVFNGTITHGTSAGVVLGGIIGWGDDYKVKMNHVLFCGNYRGSIPFYPIGIKGRYSKVTEHQVQNVLYTTEGLQTEDDYFGVKGSASIIENDAEEMGLLTKDYGLIKCYENGIGFGGKYYRQPKQEGLGTKDDPFIISSQAAWVNLQESINRGNTYQGKYLKLTTDVSATRCITGTFSGDLDCSGHKINANIHSEEEYTALFVKVNGATLRNLNLAGNMEVGNHGAALVGRCDGDLTLEGVLVTAEVRYKRGFAMDYLRGGGIIGHAINAKLKLNGVVCKASIKQSEASFLGGIIGWGDNYQAEMSRVLYCGTYDGSAPFTPLAAKYDQGNAQVKVSYTFSLSDNKNISSGNVAAYPVKYLLTDDPVSCGRLLNDNGLMRVYLRGIYFEGKYYRTTELAEAGTEDDPYTVSSKEDWDYIIDKNDADGFAGKYFQMKRDFNVDRVFGNTFKGNFDGGGHTISPRITGFRDDTALFSHVNGATIRNLKMGGTMELGKHGAALVSKCDGDLTLENIVVSTDLSYKFDGDAYGGGIVGHAENATLNLSGVVFNGTMKAVDNRSDRILGGIIGWGDNYTATLTDVVFSGTYEGDTPFTPIAAKYNEANAKVTAYNALYTQESKNVGDTHIAARGFKANTSYKADDCGKQVKDYGQMQAYENGLQHGIHYYSSAELYGRGTQEHPYLIRSADDWKLATTYNSRGYAYHKVYLKATADFETVLSFDKTFCGNLDGDGHTITVNIQDNANLYTALFRSVNGATIRNLKLAGDMKVTTHGAALVGGCDGELTLENIVVTTNVECKAKGGDTYGGGVIGHAKGSKLNLSGVVYSGKMTAVDETLTRMMGGIIGWGDNYTATMSDVLFCGTYEGTISFTPIAAKAYYATVKITANNALYTQATEGADDAFAAVWGMKAKVSNDPEDCGSLVKDYGLLQAYENGFKYGNKYYITTGLPGHGTVENPYLIGSADEWKLAARYSRHGNAFLNQYLKVTADFTTDQSLDKTFSGNLDGDGHTITSNIKDPNSDYTALFRNVKGANIHNLKLAGSMEVGKHGAALVGRCEGDLTLQNVVVSADVTIGKGDNAGGVIGHAANATLNLSGVVYSGNIVVQSENVVTIGGIIGWGDNYTVIMNDVLFNGTKKLLHDSDHFLAIAVKYNEANVKVTASNVVHVEDDFNDKLDCVAYRGELGFSTGNEESCGPKTTKYGLLQAYQRGFLLDGKLYRSAVLIHAGTQEDPYLFYSREDWEYNCSNGETEGFPGKFFKLKSDITVESGFYEFKGTFDGDGHTITTDIHNKTNLYTALFKSVNGATIRNLRVAGFTDVTNHGAPLVGRCDGDLTLENIVVSADVDYIAKDGENYGGGVIGHAANATLNLSGVVFNGRMRAIGESSNRIMGGIIGWGDNYTATLNDVLFCGEYLGETIFTPIAAKYNEANVKVTAVNVLYTEVSTAGDAYIAVKGYKANLCDKEDDYSTLLKDYGQLQAYTNGLKFGDKYYITTGLYGRGTQDLPYLIRSGDDWNTFRDRIEAGETFKDKFLKVTADFTTTVSIAKTFSGTLDGDVHTITTNIEDNENLYTAPFRSVNGATIRNLKLTGDMKVTHHGAGLVGRCDGDLTLENIVVSTNFENLNRKKENYGGGVIGNAQNSKLTLRGVVYSGKIYLKNTWSGCVIGGIIGWGDNYTVDLKDILFCGIYDGYVTFAPIAGKQKKATVKAKTENVFYTPAGRGEVREEYIAVKGQKVVLSDDPSKLGSLLFDYGLLQAYENGISFDGNFYCEETPTGIDEIENGEIDNSSDAQWYTFDGRRLDGKPTKKGLYICNGRKVAIK